MPTTKVRFVLDLEYDIFPSRYNKIEIQKILALLAHQIEQDKLATWEDVPLKVKTHINLNPYYKKQTKTTTQEAR